MTNKSTNINDKGKTCVCSWTCAGVCFPSSQISTWRPTNISERMRFSEKLHSCLSCVTPQQTWFFCQHSTNLWQEIATFHILCAAIWNWIWSLSNVLVPHKAKCGTDILCVASPLRSRGCLAEQSSYVWNGTKGSHPLRKVQFFLTLFKRGVVRM